MNLTGTNLADNLTGSNFADIIRGLAGNDRIAGRGGPDILLGGAGNDTLFGGVDVTSHPVLTAKGYNDELYGGSGRDTIHVGRGDGAFGDSDNNASTVDKAFSDTFVLYGGEDGEDAAHIVGFDVAGHGTGSKVQDHFVFAAGDSDNITLSFVSFNQEHTDANGFWARLTGVHFAGPNGELVDIETWQGPNGGPIVHYADNEEAVANVHDLVQEWSL